MTAAPLRKLYHTIAEASEATGVDAHVLRYWETEFPSLKPRKNRSGHRAYTDDDLALVRRIAHLLREEKYTIEGARQQLRRARTLAPSAPGQAATLHDLRAFLRTVLDGLPAEPGPAEPGPAEPGPVRAKSLPS